MKKSLRKKRHFITPEFRKRLIADYLNVLEDQKERLEIAKLRLFANYPNLKVIFEEKMIYHIDLAEIIEIFFF
jgi:hypothetical protein